MYGAAWSKLISIYKLLLKDGTCIQFIEKLCALHLYKVKDDRERSGSVVEGLTRERRAAGSSLTGVTALCPWARTLILA